MVLKLSFISQINDLVSSFELKSWHTICLNLNETAYAYLQ
jgi:hypothetical protein